MHIKSQTTRRILVLITQLLFGGCLSILFLFNLPLFYEQDRLRLASALIATWVVFALAVALAFKLLLVPLKDILAKNKVTIVFITILSLLLIFIFYSTSSYYWATPKYHQIEICYQSNNPSGALKLYTISEAKIVRVFPANFFSYESYPITIPVGKCISGGIRTVQRWQGIIINLETKESNDTITVEINRQTTRKILAEVGETNGRQNITIPASPFRGSPIYPNILSNVLVLAIKWAALIFSSIYLALLVFAVSDRIIFSNNYPTIFHKVALGFVLAYFMIFGFIMVNHNGQPDQTMHTYYSARYSETWGIPTDDPKSIYYTTDNEYLYYWMNGAAAKLFHLLVRPDTPTTDRLLWRILSVLMSTCTVYYIYKITSKVTGNELGGVLAAFFCANTLMFVFISGGVSYDNLMSLASTAAIYHIVCILKRDDYLNNTAWTGIWLCLGSLAKNQVALLAFILFSVWLVYSIHNRKAIKLQFSYANIILAVIFVLTSGLFLEFYGGNLIKYHRPIPRCEQVKDPKACTAFSYRKEYYQEVDYGKLWVERNTIVGPFEYALNYWSYGMINGIWGIVSHKTYVPKFATSLHGLLIIWAVLCMARYWKKENTASVVLVIIVLCYSGYVFRMNYNGELHYNFRHYAVQGRYLFPVFGAFLAIMVNSFLSIRTLFLKRLTLSLAIILYFAGGLGTFIFRYSEVFIAWRIFR